MFFLAIWLFCGFVTALFAAPLESAIISPSIMLLWPLNMSRNLLFLSLISVSLLTSHAALAAKSGYYRWTDAEGEVHFSQKPPVGKAYEFIESQTGKRSAATESTNDSAMPPPESEQDLSPDAKMEVLPPKDPAICQQAKSNMQSLNAAGARIRATGKNGEVRYLTPEEIEVQKLRAQDAIKVHCE